MNTMNTIYLKSIFETKDTKYKQEYLNIIQFYKDNPIKIHTSSDNYSEIQHINPKWYYKTNKLPIDNSINNKVRVPFEIHVKLHILLCKHFEYIHDNINFFKACLALAAIFRFNTSYRFESIKLLSNNIINEAKIYRFKAGQESSKRQKGQISYNRKYSTELLINMFNDYLLNGAKYNNGWNFIKQKYANTNFNFKTQGITHLLRLLKIRNLLSKTFSMRYISKQSKNLEQFCIKNI